jgi:hypothetical protein
VLPPAARRSRIQYSVWAPDVRVRETIVPIAFAYWRDGSQRFATRLLTLVRFLASAANWRRWRAVSSYHSTAPCSFFSPPLSPIPTTSVPPCARLFHHARELRMCYLCLVYLVLPREHQLNRLAIYVLFLRRGRWTEEGTPRPIGCLQTFQTPFPPFAVSLPQSITFCVRTYLPCPCKNQKYVLYSFG